MSAPAIIILCGFVACAVGGFLLGLAWSWTHYEAREREQAARAAVLDQRDELITMRSAEVTEVTNSWARDDSGFPVRIASTDLPPRNAGMSTKATEFPFVPVAALASIEDAARATQESAYLTPAHEPAVWGSSPAVARSQAEDQTIWGQVDGFYASWDTFRTTLAEAFLAWVLGLPERVLIGLALVFAYWPHRTTAAAPLSAPMAYRPPVPVVSVVPGRIETPMPGTSVMALLDRLRAERGEVGPRTEAPPRHGADEVPGTQAQRDREAVAAQRYEARAARATVADAHPRIFDTQEMVMPPRGMGHHNRRHSLTHTLTQGFDMTRTLALLAVAAFTLAGPSNCDKPTGRPVAPAGGSIITMSVAHIGPDGVGASASIHMAATAVGDGTTVGTYDKMVDLPWEHTLTADPGIAVAVALAATTFLEPGGMLICYMSVNGVAAAPVRLSNTTDVMIKQAVLNCGAHT